MTEDDCIFCKIVTGELPCYKVYEDEHCIAFLDKKPITRGHTLVVPKIHVDRLKDLPDEKIGELVHALKKVIKIVEKLASDYNIACNQGAIAGQIIFHLHFHIIPRYEDVKHKWGQRTEIEHDDALKVLKELNDF